MIAPDIFAQLANNLEQRRGFLDEPRRKINRAPKEIAILDMETDPFDNVSGQTIQPFVCCIYAPKLDYVIIWENNIEAFIQAVVDTINALPNRYVIYAHNGGKFDFLFLISKIRGKVAFKGRAIMSAKIGEHELRDSLHIIPTKLASYKKDDFDYSKLKRNVRNRYREEIITYLKSDCFYLYDIVKSFVDTYGSKISIGQASMSLIKKAYPQCQTISEEKDEQLREFFFGGRVECLKGAGDFVGDYNYYDVNSMYPDVMAHEKHPIGNRYSKRKGKPDKDTVFVTLECFSNKAFPLRIKNVGTCFPEARGIFSVSIHEYKAALDLDLIKSVKIIHCIDNHLQTSFDRFVLPLYERRQEVKIELERLSKMNVANGEHFNGLKKEDIFIKLLLNNGFGKFAQNPRRFREYYLTEIDERPDIESESWGNMPSEAHFDYAIWSRPLAELRFNNVGTAASITGAARAKLLRNLAVAIEPIYCDTDSIVARSLPLESLDNAKLGMWKVEHELRRMLIAGKKLYACETLAGKRLVRAKGASNLTWDDIDALVQGTSITNKALGASIGRDGSSRYMIRRLRATA